MFKSKKAKKAVEDKTWSAANRKKVIIKHFTDAINQLERNLNTFNTAITSASDPETWDYYRKYHVYHTMEPMTGEQHVALCLESKAFVDAIKAAKPEKCLEHIRNTLAHMADTAHD